MSKALEAGLDEMFDSLKLAEKKRPLVREAFLKGFEKHYKHALVEQATAEQEQRSLQRQQGIVIPDQGNVIHASGVGDLYIQGLSFRNWVRILCRRPVRDLNITTSVKELRFEERVVH